ncbi:TPA: glycyl-radical enzyme activating protein [Candidatus Poribacteria bacterium]|nr:glycyl-radical enzyme activating protein [Candidatus Poribacteria bacterium]
MDEVTGLVFDIKKFAVHDGPGIRTTVFLKGCPLHCWWCHNPESIKREKELVLFENKCIGCGECFKVCPNEAHEVLPDSNRVYHKERCVLCGKCVDICYAEALVMEGKEMTVEEVMVELRKDIPFYENSDGGITLSGGEPLFQHEFALAILKQCKAEGLHTAIDTSGQISWRIYERVLPYVDLVLYDFKHIDPVAHKKYTGVSNDLILDNLVKMSEYGVPIEIRMPIIPGVNDSKKDIVNAAMFLSTIKNITWVELLPYHRLGESKYSRLGEEYRLEGLQPPPKEKMNEIAEWIRSYDLEVHVGG